MNETYAKGLPGGLPGGLAGDFVAMWQSELTAMAADREMRECWSSLVSLWAQSTYAALAFLPHDAAPRSPRAAQPPGTAPVAATPGARLGEVEQLANRVAELEQRLAELLGRRPEPDRPNGVHPSF